MLCLASDSLALKSAEPNGFSSRLVRTMGSSDASCVCVSRRTYNYGTGAVSATKFFKSLERIPHQDILKLAELFVDEVRLAMQLYQGTNTAIRLVIVFIKIDPSNGLPIYM